MQSDLKKQRNTKLALKPGKNTTILVFTAAIIFKYHGNFSKVPYRQFSDPVLISEIVKQQSLNFLILTTVMNIHCKCSVAGMIVQ